MKMIASAVLVFGLVSGSGLAKPLPLPPAAPLIAQELNDPSAVAQALREYYTKSEFRIAMRDGVHLYTVAYVPKDHSRTYPILMVRTPYGLTPYGVDNTPTPKTEYALRNFSSAALIRSGYIFVQQDVRGRMMSEGKFVDIRPIGASKTPSDVDETTDTYDTIEWLLHRLPNNGRVGMWGISYPGFYAAVGALSGHPALKAVSPQAPVTDWFSGDDVHHNGAFFLAETFGFDAVFGVPRPEPTTKWADPFDYQSGDLYDFFLRMGPLSNADARYFKGKLAFWKDEMEHGVLDDFWRARDPLPHYKNIKPAILTVGGWFDCEDLYGTLATYRAIEKQNRGAANTIVMGPWKHGGWLRTDGDRLGDVQFGMKTSKFYQEKIELPFFEHYLKDAPLPPPPEAWMYETGSNEWRSYEVWPPRQVKTASLFFDAAGALKSAAPTAASGFDQYVSDPSHPVPYIDKYALQRFFEYMTADQRFAARRPDVVTYASTELNDEMVLAGPLEADLWITTTGSDADFVVKLIDVYPATVVDPDPNPSGARMAGYQQLVRAEVMRAKFRDGLDRSTALVAQTPTRIRFSLPDVNHAFRRGHQIMVQVQSSWFPLVDRNPQTFVDIYHAQASDFHPATHCILRDANHPSKINLPLLRGALPN